MTTTARILISGYYGSGNAGDEAILAALVAAFRRLRPGAELVVLSASPQATAAEHGVEAIPRFSLRALRQELGRCRLLVSGGGGLLQDTTSWRSPLYYLGVIRLAQRSGLRTAALCQGIGPLRRAWLRRLTAKIFHRLDLIAVRDEASARILAEIGIPTASIYLAADAAWLLDPPQNERTASLPGKEGIALERPAVGLFLRPLPKEAPALSSGLWEAIAAALAGFCGKRGGRPVFVPMQRPGDVQAAEEVMKRLSIEARQLSGKYSPADLLGLTVAFDMVIGMRLHGLIFAARMGVPPVGISYDPKVDALLSAAGLRAAFSADKPEGEALALALEDTWQKREEIRRSLSLLSEECRQKAAQAVERALALLD